MHDKRKRSAGETGFNALLFLASLFLLWSAYDIAGFSSMSSPGALPMAVSFVMVVSSGLILLGNLRTPARDDTRFLTAILPPVVIVVTLLIVAYVVLLVPLGFLPTSLLFMVLAIMFLRKGGLVHAVGVSVFSLAIIYVIFRLIFSVLLPTGMVPEGEILAYFRGLL